MRRMRGDDGAVAVLIALLAVVLLGFGALVIDVGILYAEKRELQTGADAAALAIANECVVGDCTQAAADSLATEMASANASDDAASADVCGTAGPGWTAACEIPKGMPLGAKYIRVTTTTLTSDQAVEVPPALAKVLDPSYDGTTVRASSVVVIGGPLRTGTSIPLILSACEWKTYTEDGQSYAPLPHEVEGDPYYDDLEGEIPYPVAMEAEIVLHKGDEDTCKAGGGFNETIPGGFGWLQTVQSTGPDKSCEADITQDETTGEILVDSKQGFSPCVKDLMTSVLGEIVQIPVFALDPASKTYTVSGWAAFFVTGYYLNGNNDKTQAHIPAWDAQPACFSSASYDCITGYFLKLPETTAAVGGASFGETVVQLYE